MINLNFSKYLTKIANTSIDISDGLLIDLNKMTNNQNISSEIYYDKIPISNKLKIFLRKNSQKKVNLFLMVMTIKYCLLQRNLKDIILIKFQK